MLTAPDAVPRVLDDGVAAAVAGDDAIARFPTVDPRHPDDGGALGRRGR